MFPMFFLWPGNVSQGDGDLCVTVQKVDGGNIGNGSGRRESGHGMAGLMTRWMDVIELDE